MRNNPALYYQPVLTEEEEIALDFPSFCVFSNYHNAKKQFPDHIIACYSGDDIQEPTFVDALPYNVAKPVTIHLVMTLRGMTDHYRKMATKNPHLLVNRANIHAGKVFSKVARVQLGTYTLIQELKNS